jgi:hypothetical protein
MSTQWYYRIGEATHGPFDTAELKRLAAAGRIPPHALVSKGGQAPWVPAMNVKGLFVTNLDVPGQLTRPAPTTPTRDSVQLMPTAQSQEASSSRPLLSGDEDLTDADVLSWLESNATEDMSSGTLTDDLIACRFCGGEVIADAMKCQHCGEWLRPQHKSAPEAHRAELLTLFGVLGIVFLWPFAIAAWIMAASDLERMDRGYMDTNGRRMTQAALTLGKVGVLLMFLGILVIIMWAYGYYKLFSALLS